MIACPYNRQQGAVLVTAVIFLVLLTGVGAVVLTSTNFDLRLAGNSADAAQSTQASFGALDEVITMAAQNTLPLTMNIASMEAGMVIQVQPNIEGTDVQLTTLVDADTNARVTDCPRQRRQSAWSNVLCTSARVISDHSFNTDSAQPTAQVRALVYQRYPDLQ